jgi:hypothetical protein
MWWQMDGRMDMYQINQLTMSQQNEHLAPTWASLTSQFKLSIVINSFS